MISPDLEKLSHSNNEPRWPTTAVNRGTLHRVRWLIVAVVSVAAPSIPTLLVEKPYPSRFFLPFYFVAVLISTWWGGARSGLLATFLSVLAVDYFLMSPLGSLRVSRLDFERLVVLAVVSLMITALGNARNRSEARSREAEQKYRNIFENAVEGIFQTMPEGGFITANPALARMLGYESPEELICERRNIALQGYVDPKGRETLQRLLETQDMVAGFEHQVYRKDRSKIWISENVRAVRDERRALLWYEGTAEDITERKRAEETVRQQKEILQTVFDHIPVMISSYDEDNNVTLINREWERARGWSREEIQNQNPDMLAEGYPDLQERQRARDFITAASGEWVDFKTHVKGGRVLDTSWATVRLPDGMRINIGQDITERKQAEERLREYEKVVEGLEEMIAVVDRDYRYLIANRAFLNHRGLGRDQVIGHHVSEVLDQEIFEKIVKQELDECFQGRVVKYELRYTYPKLGERDLLISYFPIEGPGGVEQAACILQDITERKRAEDALRQAEQKYRDIFENAGEGIFQTTPQGQYIAANPALARMQGFDSPEELISSLRDISQQVYVDPARREEFKSLLEEHGVVRGFEHQLVRRDGSKIWVSVNARAVRDARGALLYYEGTAQDINERKLAEAKSAAFATLARKLSGARTQPDAGRIIAQIAGDLFGWDSCNLDLYDADRDLVHPMLNVDTIDGKQTEVTGVIANRKPTARSRRVIAHGPELLLREEPVQFDKDAIPFGDKTRPSASIMTVPIRHAAGVIGLLSIQSYTSHSYDTAALDDLQALADHCGEALNRIRAEQSLYESEERFRQMAENTEDVLWVADRDVKRALYINPAYERVFGRSCESLYERLDSFVEAVHPDDRDAVRRMLERQRKGDHEPFEYRIVQPDGSVRWILRRSFPIRNNDGEIFRMAGIAQDITERKRAEEALHESEERYRDLVENSRELICIHDLDGRILSANRAAAEALGYDGLPEGKNIRDMLAPEVRHQFDEYMARLRQDGATSGIMLVQTMSGERRVWEYYNSLRTEGVATPIVRGMARDITEQRRAEESLQLFRNLIDQSSDAIEVIDPITFRFIDCNESAHLSLGYSREEFLSLTVFDIDPGIDRSMIARLKEQLQESGFATLESLHLRKDGTTFPVEVNVKLVRLERDYRLAVVRDVTGRKHAEEALRESEERYRELFENAKEAIYVHDLSGRYVSVNRAAEQLSGFSREQILGKHYSNFVSPRDLKQARTSLCRKLDEENETIYEVNVVNRDGRRIPVEVSSRLIYENGVAVGVQGTACDITDRKRAQEALRIYSQRLIEAQEAERQKIARELHDEIGQVLTAVRINLQSVQRSCQTADCVPPLNESIGIVDEALGRVRELSIELRPSLLDDLGLSAALRWYVDRYAQRTGIIAEVLDGFKEDGRLPRDLETACFRIAQEALTNVARHAQAGSVSVQLERSRERMLLSIIDDGVGFDVDKLRKSASAASALGLRGMEERALALGGYIEIDSGLKRGTRIRATFPLIRK